MICSGLAEQDSILYIDDLFEVYFCIATLKEQFIQK